MSMTAIFEIKGGVGKHITATSVVHTYKKNHPDHDIIVVCAWPEVFIHNPNVSRVFKLGLTPYFYRDYIYDKECKVFAQEPYLQTSHILKEKHLIQSWCDLIGEPSDEILPHLFPNYRNMEQAKDIIGTPTKPVLIFQPFGGPGKTSQLWNYSWMRDIHPVLAQQLVDELSKSFHIIHICYDFHPILKNCVRLDQHLEKNTLFSLLGFSQKRLLIDSCLQHAAAALKLSSTVQWIATQPQIFGYDLHTNLPPKVSYPKGNIDSYLYDYNFIGQTHECPYSSPLDIFDGEALIKSILTY